MRRDCEISYVEKMLRAAVIAMDDLSIVTAEYLLCEIPWGKLSTEEILKLVKIVRTETKKAFKKCVVLEEK